MKKILLSFLVMLCMITIHNKASAQERMVTGKVTSTEDGEPLPGVSVIVKGTTQGSITEADGTYKLTLDPEAITLIFSFVGFKTQEIEVGASTVIDVQMELDVAQLNEVVITGYGERDRQSYTGSIATLDKSMIEDKPVSSVDQVLQGSIPGLQLGASSGTPGSVQDIRIRGLSSLTAANAPLFVIDGIPVNSGTTKVNSYSGSLGALSSINVNDIENISVLKDAVATALYGARGANGVIIITTQKGKSGQTLVSFDAQYGTVDRASSAPKMLNAAQWDELYYESLVNAGIATDLTDAKANHDNGWDQMSDTNWGEIVRNKKARSKQYNLSVNGGGDKTKYYASVGYFVQDGVTKGDNLERVTAKVNISTNLSDKINFSNSVMGSRTLQNGQLEGTAYFGNPEASYIFARPTDPAYNSDGTINIDNMSGVIYNPLWLIENNIIQNTQGRILTNSSLSIDLLPGLEFRSTLGLDYLTTEELYYDNRYYGDAAGNGDSYVDWNRTVNYVWKNQFNYSLELGTNHKVDFTAVYEAQKNDYKTVGTGGYGIAADGLYYPSSVGTADYNSGYAQDWAQNSATLIANYSFANKIFLDGSVRGEGSSRFAPGNRWGFFYAIGGSWLISEESFLSGSSWLTLAKIRASYGKTGNSGIGLNKYQSFLSYSGDYSGFPAIYPNQVGNKDLSWENNNQYALGVELGLFNKINLRIEYYHRYSYDLLFDVPLSRTTGFSSQTQNLGEMVNRGFEVSADADILRSNDFTWNLGINFTTVHNEVVNLPKDGNGEEIGIETSTYKITEGQPAYVFYMPTWAGVDPDNGSPLWYTDGLASETTSVYSEAEDTFQGGSRIATFFGGLNTRLEYKGIYLTANLYYQTGNYIYDTWAGYSQSDGRYTFTIANAYARQYDRWQKPGDISPNPININGNTEGGNSHSTRRLYDGTFMRLRNLTLGYNLPAKVVSPLKLSGLSIYVQGNNLWTWKKDPLLEFDPEVRADGTIPLTPAVLKTFTVGLKIKI